MNEKNNLKLDKNNNIMTKSHKRVYTPIKMFNIYVLLTLLMSIIGPWEYIGYNKIYVTLYVIIFLIVSTITYIHFVNRRKNIVFVVSKSRKILKKNIDGLWITKKSIVISLLLFSAILFSKIRILGFPKINNLFRLMAKAYTDKNIIGGSFNISAWLFNYFSVFYVISIVLGTYYFLKLDKKYQFMYFLVILLSLTYHLLYVGNQKAIGDLLIYLGSVFLVKHAQIGKDISIKNIIFGSISIMVAFLIFSNVIQNRMDLWNVEYYSIGNRAFLDIDHWMLSLFGDNIKLGAGTLLFYLSSGYYGLSLSLELPFKWSYGFGSSFEMRYLFRKVFPITDEFIQSYPVRMESQTGWDAYSNWHTIFPWLASDFTFFGAVIFICLFVAAYAVSWNMILKKGHWTNILLFSNINIMLLYIPANNQLFQTRASLLVTLLISLLWIFNYNNSGDEL